MIDRWLRFRYVSGIVVYMIVKISVMLLFWVMMNIFEIGEVIKLMKSYGISVIVMFVDWWNFVFNSYGSIGGMSKYSNLNGIMLMRKDFMIDFLMVW